MRKNKIRTIDDIKDAVNKFYNAIHGSCITKDGWKLLPFDDLATCFPNEPIDEEHCNNMEQKSREEKKVIADKKRRRELNNELADSLYVINGYIKGHKKYKIQNKKEIGDLEKRFNEVEEKLLGRITTLEEKNQQIEERNQKLMEDNQQIKEAFEFELNRSYIEWADTYSTLSQNPSREKYNELRRRQISNVEMAEERHKSLDLVCENAY